MDWMIVALWATFIVVGLLVLVMMWPVLAVLASVIYGTISGI